MNYKIVYFAFVSANFGGVEQKVIAQYDALCAIGAEIDLFLVSSFTSDMALNFEIGKRPSITMLINSPRNINNPWTRRKEKFELITSILLTFDPQNTIVYFRYPGADRIFLRFLRKNKGYKFVTEHQEIENTFSKYKFNGTYLRNLLEIIWGKSVRRNITGFVGVTEEIVDYQKSRINQKRKFYEVIGNGIDISRYSVRVPISQEKCSFEVRILFVGAGFKTHGLARLILSLHNYFKYEDNSEQIKIIVAGDSNEMKSNKILAAKLNLLDSIDFMGYLDKDALGKLYDWAHIGVGSLAIHRKGLKNTSELKAREYCARGLPFFWSPSDDDFKHDFPYIHQIPANDDAFDLKPILEFAKKMIMDPSHPLEMRQYANRYLKWSVKMKRLIEFFDKIML